MERPYGVMPRMRGRYRSALDNYGLVLGLIVATMVLAGLVSPREPGGIAVAALLAATLALALRTSGVGRARLVILRAMALLSVALVAASQVAPQATGIIYLAVMILLIVATQAAIVLRVARHPTVSLETVLGALCVYLLLGLLFAYIYGLVAAATGTFFVQTGPHATSDYIYFSIITLATVGYGDLTAATPFARTFVMAEALTGQLYLVTVISLIVGTLGAERAGRVEKESQDG